MFFIWEDFDWLLRLNHAVPVAISNVVRSAQVAVRVDVTITTVRHSVRAAVLVVELAVRTYVVAKAVCT